MGLVEKTSPAASQEFNFLIRTFGISNSASVDELIVVEATGMRRRDRPLRPHADVSLLMMSSVALLYMVSFRVLLIFCHAVILASE